jgi:hypothetical protein
VADESNWAVVPSGKRGFASMTPEKRREISSKGGKAGKPENRAFSVNRELAAEAGRKSGKASRPSKRSFSMDPRLASRAGKLGALKRAKQ